MKAKKRELPIIQQRINGRKMTRNVIAHKAHSWEEAEKWDIEYWQKLTPQKRISALESIRRDWEAIKDARK